MGSRRHLARRSVGHLWHFIKWRSWPAMERKKDRSGGGGGSGKSRRKRGTAQSGFITRWAAESGTELGSSRAATCTSWTRGISLRPGAPWRPFNIGRGRDAIHAPRDALQPLRLIRARAHARFVPSANEKWDRSTRHVPWPHQPPRERRRYCATGRIARRLPSLRWLTDVVRSGLLLRVLIYIVAWSRYSLRDRIIIWWFKVWC